MDQEILSALVNSSHESILTTDYSGKVLFCNKSSENLLNLTAEKLLNLNIFDLIAKEDITEIKRIIRLLSEEGSGGLTYLARFNNSNEDRPLKVEVKKLKVKKNRQILFIITPHTREEEEAHKLYKLLAENAYDINIMFEGDELIYVSPSIKDFLGYDVEEIDSLDTWNGLIHDEDLPVYIQQLKSDQKNKTPFSYYTYRQKHKDGRYRWFETKIRREFRKNGLVVEMATSVDITQRKKFEMELEMQKEFIEQLFDTDPNLIFVRDGNGRMIYCNKAVAELVGKSREHVFLEG